MKLILSLLFVFIISIRTFAQSDYKTDHYNLNKIVSLIPIDNTIHYYETAF